MSKSNRRLRTPRRTQIESLEDRLAMSADPLLGLISHHGSLADGSGQIQHHAIVEDGPADIALSHHGAAGGLTGGFVSSGFAEDPPQLEHHDFGPIEVGHHTEPQPDFWLDPISSTDDEWRDTIGEVEQTLSSAHNQTGLTGVRTDYGFTGGGQTVAVIDSGIAYDHWALGGGFGSNYRVVGGWDFTSENDADPYDDGPEGSHGTHVAGIIGSSHETHQGVAPDVDLVGLRVFDDNGNGYFSWVENALDWVIQNRTAFENPITAINLSLGINWNSDSVPSWANLEDEFAQLEADGVFISVSAGNRFSSYNTPGLSYPAASPYVVPVMSTDDSGFLSSFSQRHQNGIAAPGRYIYSTVPDYVGNNNGVTDDWANFSGTSMAAPYVAGASVIIREAMEFVGYQDIDQDTIYAHMRATADTVHDSSTGLDYLRLNIGAAIDALMPTDDYGSTEETAYDLGTVTAGLSQASAMNMDGVISTLTDSDYFTFTAGSTGTVTFTASQTTHDLDASWVGLGGEGWTGQGGQSYTMSVVAGQEYTVALSSGDGLGYYSLDITAESTFSYTDWGAINGQQTQSNLTAGAETWYRIAAGQDGYVTTEALYDSGTVNFELYDANQGLITTAANGRIDHNASSGEEFYLRVWGSASGVDLRLTNLVSAVVSTVTITGTDAADAFAFTAGANGHTVTVNGVDYDFNTAHTTFNFEGGAGFDTITMTGSSGDDTATLSEGSVVLSGEGYSASATSVSSSLLRGGGGIDNATFVGSAGDDVFVAWSTRAVMTGNGYYNDTRGFDSVLATAGGGTDEAYFHDSTGDDMYVAWSTRAVMAGNGYYNDARGFESTRAQASAGLDEAYFHGSSGNDTYVAWSTRAVMSGSGFYNDARGFDSTRAEAYDGYDQAYLHDTAGDEVFSGWSDRATMTGAGFSNDARGFDRTQGYATSGYDEARFYDSAGDDMYVAWSSRAVMAGSGFYNDARRFDATTAYATSGYDRAFFHDSAGDDAFYGWSDRAHMTGTGFSNEGRGFDNARAYSNTGDDTAYFYDSAGNDVYVAWSSRAVMAGTGFYNDARGFARTQAYSSAGSDDAHFHDSAGDDDLHVETWGAYATGADYRNDATGFAKVNAYCNAGGNDAVFSEAVDYAFEEHNSWA